MKTVVVTADELSQIVTAALKLQLDVLKAHLDRQLSANSPEYLSTEETLKLLHISKPTLHKLRDRGVIEAVRSSDNRVLYRRSQIEAYLNSTQQKGGVKRA